MWRGCLGRSGLVLLRLGWFRFGEAVEVRRVMFGSGGVRLGLFPSGMVGRGRYVCAGLGKACHCLVVRGQFWHVRARPSGLGRVWSALAGWLRALCGQARQSRRCELAQGTACSGAARLGSQGRVSFGAVGSGRVGRVLAGSGAEW
jgi:hypothetical protein